MLLEGKYLTSSPYDLPGREYVAKVELAYRGSRVRIPYYRFLVELPEENEACGLPEGLKTFGAYYVPAVEGKYLDGVPYDVPFN